jgi:hypothetical protein
MTHHIDLKPETRAVWVIHSGDVDLTDMESSRAKAVALLTERGYSRLLVDTRATVRHPTQTEHHRFASSQPLYMPPHIAVAVLLTPDQFKMQRQFEALSINQGVLMKAFDDLDEAQAWLARITN